MRRGARSASLVENGEFDQVELGLAAIPELGDEIFLIRIPEGSGLADSTMSSSRLGELAGARHPPV